MDPPRLAACALTRRPCGRAGSKALLAMGLLAFFVEVFHRLHGKLKRFFGPFVVYQKVVQRATFSVNLGVRTLYVREYVPAPHVLKLPGIGLQAMAS